MTDHRITELDSGVRIVTEAMPSVRSVSLGYWIGTGSRHEGEPEAGLSHLIEHLLFKGSDRYASVEIDQIFDAMGAELNAGTGKETTSLYARVIDAHLADAFDVMSEMVWRPAFRDVDESEREVILEEIAMYEDDPQDKVFDVLGEAVFGDASARARDHRPRGGRRRDAGRADPRLPRRALRAAQRRDRGGRRGRPRRARGAGGGARAGRRRDRAQRAAAPVGGELPRAGALRAQGHRAVPRLRRRARARARRRAPLRAARARHDLRRDLVLAPVPGGARAARARLRRLVVQRPVRRHRPGRPVRRHAAGQPRAGAGGDRARAGASAPRPGERRGAGPREGEPQGARRAVARVDRRAHEPARLAYPRRRAAAVRRRGDRADRRRHARGPASRSPASCSRPSACRPPASAPTRTPSTRRSRRWRPAPQAVAA